MKDRSERQKRLLDELTYAKEPISGAELAERCEVTRQVVVHDIALLRAQGIPIVSTPRGYVLQLKESETSNKLYILSVKHPPELTGIELQTLVDYGLRVKDVIVEHPLYGELRGSLHLASRRDVQLYMQKLHASEGILLSQLTDGFHLHTVECDQLEHLREAIHELRRNGIQVYDEP